jgi:hypothetical protein
MEKKRVFVLAAILFLCVFILLNMVSIYFFSVPFSPVAITGKVVDTGIVRLYVEGNPRLINISFPLNTTYDNTTYTCTVGGHPKCTDFRYNLTLNVTADFFVDEAVGWKYSLYDLEHSVYINEDTAFTPNASIAAVRWGNLLTVSAYEEDIGWQSQDVTFTVDVPDSSPILGSINETILVCESTRLNGNTGYLFNASDEDEDTLTGDLSPKNGTFFVLSAGSSGNNISLFKIVSASIPKSQVANYNKTISVVDTTGLADTAVTNISVIEINNPPVMTGLGAQTVWLSGEDSNFYYQMEVTDVENGDTADGGLTFNITVSESLFSINSTHGIINYTPSSGEEETVYSVTVCVNDTALSSTHENISYCSPRSGAIESACDDFTLTVTDDNRVPGIVANSPASPFSVGGTTTTVFSASVSDDDMVNAWPDLDWYVNGVLAESNENISSDTYSWSAGCGNSGIYNVTAITSDGPTSNSTSWNVTVTNVACPVATTGGGGGGGGGGGTLSGYCRESWVCNDWKVCQNVERSFTSKGISPEDYIRFKEICSQNQYDDRFCGFQITSCQDLELCNSTTPKVPRPSEMKICYFTENPNCIDGITNCHDGSCELLVDCGGPCGACPTCSDNIQNQGESGADCGGPCPYTCLEEEALSGTSFAIIGLSTVAVGVAGFAIWKLAIIVFHLFLLSKKRKKKRKV